MNSWANKKGRRLNQVHELMPLLSRKFASLLSNPGRWDIGPTKTRSEELEILTLYWVPYLKGSTRKQSPPVWEKQEYLDLNFVSEGKMFLIRMFSILTVFYWPNQEPTYCPTHKVPWSLCPAETTPLTAVIVAEFCLCLNFT